MKCPTVFVLGAGASVSYGLPEGSGLVSEIQVRLSNRIRESHGGRVSDEEIDRLSADDRTFSNRIRYSRAPTIDAFLRDIDDRDRYIDAMGRVIWKAESNAIQFPSGVDRADAADDWIAWLYHNRLLRSPREFKNNQFSVVSFNYDRIPLLLLATMMHNIFGGTAEDLLAHLRTPLDCGLERFVHVHGHLSGTIELDFDERSRVGIIHSKYPKGEDSGTDTAGLSTMYDPGIRETTIDVVREHFLWAKRVVFLGLGYHSEICDSLRMALPSPSRLRPKLMGTAFRLDDEQRDITEKQLLGIELGDSKERCKQFLVGRI